MPAGIAYIIETRTHPNFDKVVKNVDHCLPKDWQIWCFHSKENKEQITKTVSKLKRKTRSIPLKQPIKTLNDYNDLLFSPSFWQQFKLDHLIGFQIDTWMNPMEKHRINELYEFDYVGAPWDESVRKRWDYIPELGGNGGFVYSKKSARLTALENSITPKISGHPFYQSLQEDVWFSTAIAELGMKLPSVEQASGLFVESIFTEKPLAVHKPWQYLSDSNFQRLVDIMPELKQIQPTKKRAQERSKYSSYRNFLLQYGRSNVFAHQFDQADACLQIIHSRYPKKSYTAYNLQALAAFHLGALSQAKHFAEQSLVKQPQFAKARDNLAIIERHLLAKQASMPGKEKEEAYLAIPLKYTDFESGLSHLIEQLLIAEICDRTPVIQKQKSGHFLNHFHAISDLRFADLSQFKGDMYPEKWNKKKLSDSLKLGKKSSDSFLLNNIPRDERVVISEYSNALKSLKAWLPPEHPLSQQSEELNVLDVHQWLIKKYLKPTKETEQKFTDFVKKQFAKDAFIAIHLADGKTIPNHHGCNIAAINQYLIDQLSSYDDSLKIFALGTDKKNLAALKKQFGKRVIRSRFRSEVLDTLIAKNAEHILACGLSSIACYITSDKEEAKNNLVPFNVLTRFSTIPSMEDHL